MVALVASSLAMPSQIAHISASFRSNGGVVATLSSAGVDTVGNAEHIPINASRDVVSHNL